MNLQCLFIIVKEEKEIHEKNVYYFLGDMLVCGLKNGALWILHHITLDPIDEIPYKHSSTAINKIIFTRCAEYMAYAVRNPAFHDNSRIILHIVAIILSIKLIN